MLACETGCRRPFNRSSYTMATAALIQQVLPMVDGKDGGLEECPIHRRGRGVASRTQNNELAKHNAALNSSLSEMRSDRVCWKLNFSHTVDSYIKDPGSDWLRSEKRGLPSMRDLPFRLSDCFYSLHGETTERSRSVGDGRAGKGGGTRRPSFRGTGFRGGEVHWSRT